MQKATMATQTMVHVVFLGGQLLYSRVTQNEKDMCSGQGIIKLIIFTFPLRTFFFYYE